MKRICVADNLILMQEWNWEKNNGESISPDMLLCGSSKAVWWKCKMCNYEWKTSPGHRNHPTKPTGCPHCAALERAQKRKDQLQLNHNITLEHPELLKEWDFEKNTDSTPENITKGSHQKIWWKCQFGHSWQATIGNRLKGSKCPFCSGRLVVAGKTDLLSQNPTLAQEWNYEKNGNLLPSEVTKSTARKVWWKCHNGHEWEASIANRNKKRGCPICSKHRKTSVPEKAIGFYLSRYFTDVVFNQRFPWLENLELDLYIPTLKLGIEYDGVAWHFDNERDQKKDALCHKNNLKLIRIREDGLQKYSSTCHFIYTGTPDSKLTFLQSVIKELFEIIKSISQLPLCPDIDLTRDYYDILAMLEKCEDSQSLPTKFPHLLKEWNYDKNGNLCPESLSSGSSKKVWWKCENGHEWRTSVANRTNISNQNKCPYCQNKKVLKGYNDLITLRTPFLQDWDYNKNVLSPECYTLHSGKKVWWKCKSCGYEWMASPDTRVKHGCKRCAMITAGKKHARKVICIETNEQYNSVIEASESTGISVNSISRVCRGERKTTGGYHWKYVE